MGENTFTQKIGNTTFIIAVKTAEKAKETVEDKLKKLIKKEVLEMAKSEENQYFSDPVSIHSYCISGGT